jgi:hypothetical protein
MPEIEKEERRKVDFLIPEEERERAPGGTGAGPIEDRFEIDDDPVDFMVDASFPASDPPPPPSHIAPKRKPDEDRDR